MTLLSAKRFRKISIVFLLVLLGVGNPLTVPIHTVQSVALASYSDTMSRQKINEDSSHTFVLTLGGSTTLDGSGNETVSFDFDEPGGGFIIADSGWDTVAPFDDFSGTVTKASSPAAITILTVTVGTSPVYDCTGAVGVNDMAVTVDTDDGIITFTACSSYTNSDGGADITINVNLLAGNGGNLVTNSSSTSTYSIAVAAAGETGTLSQVILNDDQVIVSALVSPSLTVSLSSNSCALANGNALTSTSLGACTYNIEVDTNSSNGYLATLIDDGNLRTGGGDDIDDEGGDQTIASGSEEYGVSTSSDAISPHVAPDVPTFTDCTTPNPTSPNVGEALLSSASVIVAGSTQAISESIAICHIAGISTSTNPGSYSHVVTVTVTALY